MMHVYGVRRVVMGLSVVVAAVVASTSAHSEYIFTTPQAKTQNRIYWLDRYTGSVGACQFVPKAGTPGIMQCFPPGDNAQSMPSGDYDLMPTSLENELGIFRLNRTTGETSLCFVKDEKVLCTPQAIAR